MGVGLLYKMEWHPRSYRVGYGGGTVYQLHQSKFTTWSDNSPAGQDLRVECMPVMLIAECTANCRLCCNSGFLPPLKVYTKASMYGLTFTQVLSVILRRNMKTKTLGPFENTGLGEIIISCFFCYLRKSGFQMTGPWIATSSESPHLQVPVCQIQLSQAWCTSVHSSTQGQTLDVSTTPLLQMGRWGS